VRSARKGRNPATGAEISIPETKARAAAQLRPPGARGRARCTPTRLALTPAFPHRQAPAFSAGKSFKDHVKGVAK
jgi:hypothetical protein